MEVGAGIDMESSAQASIGPSRRKVVIEKRTSLFDMGWSDLWEYRELGYVLVWRDITVRYKQTAIGVAWVMLQPVIALLIFTAIFGVMAKLPSDGVWYPAFAMTALPLDLFRPSCRAIGGKYRLQCTDRQQDLFPTVMASHCHGGITAR
jgi:hypothetical protein